MGNKTSHLHRSSSDDLPTATTTRPIEETNPHFTKNQSLLATQRSSSLQMHFPKSRALRHSIVTVHEKTTEEDTLPKDPAMIALQNVTQFYPIIRETVRNPVMKDINTITNLDIQAAYCFVTKYQFVVKEGANSVTRNQQQLSQRVLDMDYAIATLHQILQEKSRKLAKQTERLSTISQIKALLNSSRMCLRSSEETLDRINGCLPLEHRLGSLDLSSHFAQTSHR